MRGWSHAFTQHQQCTFKVRLENKQADDLTPRPPSPPPPAAAAVVTSPAPAVVAKSDNSKTDVAAAGSPQPTTNSSSIGMFSKHRVGSFGFAGPLRRSLDQFDEADALNLWKKCTSYSPTLKHMLPKWTRQGTEGGGSVEIPSSVEESSSETVAADSTSSNRHTETSHTNSTPSSEEKMLALFYKV